MTDLDPACSQILDVAGPDKAILRTFPNLDPVIPDLSNHTGLQARSHGLLDVNGARSFESGLNGTGVPLRVSPFGALENQILESKVPDRCFLGPDNTNDPVDDGNLKGGFVDSLANSWDVINLPLLEIVVPLCPLVQSLPDILKVIPRGLVFLPCVLETKGGSPVEGHCVSFEIDTLDSLSRLDPPGVGDDLHIGQVFEIANIPFIEHRTERSVVPIRFAGNVDDFREMIKGFLGKPRELGTVAIHIELAERFRFQIRWEVGDPNPVSVHSLSPSIPRFSSHPIGLLPLRALLRTPLLSTRSRHPPGRKSSVP